MSQNEYTQRSGIETIRKIVDKALPNGGKLTKEIEIQRILKKRSYMQENTVESVQIT
jgi:hypothetical protein